MKMASSSSSNATGPNELEEQSFDMETIQDRMKHLLATGHHSDVHFVFGNDGEEKEVIKAHKIVLVPASPYFAARFRFENNAATIAADNQQQQIVVINDIEAKPSAFRAVLNFLYTNDMSLINADNFIDVYALSKKFMLRVLAQECVELACTMLNAKNLLSAWRLAKLHDETALVNLCWEFIDKKIWLEDLVATDEFKSLNRDEISEIIGRDTLRETEIHLFEVLGLWASMKHAEEHKNDIEPTAEEKRAIIGPAIYSIRFPLIRPKDFINKIVPTGILDKDEMLAMFLHYAEDSNDDVKAKYPLKFLKNQRDIKPTQKINKLMDKQRAEDLKAEMVIELEDEKANLTRLASDNKAEIEKLTLSYTRSENRAQTLRDKMREANDRLRACGEHGIQY